ncbi:hypothetical protein GCM10010451_39500 [Streptomyces virens]|uniref:DUF397 domain-containing protein n=1 Tax=Streptomyces virens TaxID=285572 RepID=A0ABP6PQM5_9ACTN|nr:MULTISPECIES: DUF397 domain-containing protein [Streptomyces]MBA8976949.1 hypothetical protein [Streptomyces calvus]MYS28292.1 DUF397 domain-containing protein [Streptomyces sp. SID7804]
MTDRIVPDSAALIGWRKSSHSGSEAGSCLEVLDGHSRGVPVRDSKVPHGPAVIIPESAWSAFVTAVRSGGFPS